MTTSWRQSAAAEFRMFKSLLHPGKDDETKQMAKKTVLNKADYKHFLLYQMMHIIIKS